MTNTEKRRDFLTRRQGTPPERDALGLPKWRLENLGDEDYSIVSEYLLKEQFKMCSVCGVFQHDHKMATCSGCGKLRAHRIYYCSHQCQKADWDKHRLICGKDHDNPQKIQIRINGRLVRGEVRRAWGRWISLKPVIEWAAKQAFLSSRVQDPEYYCMDFEFSVDPREPKFPLHFRRVKFRGDIMNPLARSRKIGSDGRPVRQGYYIARCEQIRFYISGVVKITGKLDEDDLDAPIPHWPWILEHVAFKLETDVEVTMLMLRLLVNTVKEYCRQQKRNSLIAEPNIFDQYCIPRSFLSWKLPKDWREFMGEVVDFRT